MFSDPNGPHKNIHTRSSIWRMFRDAADEDYLSARYSARLNLAYQFCWNSQQCLEKLMKAVLLLNERPVSEYSHNLEAMLQPITELAQDLLPIILCPPHVFETSESRLFRSGNFEPFERYIKRVNEYGDPNNRYRIFSIVLSGYDLNKLDQAVYFLRRIAFPLDLLVEGTQTSARDLLLRDRLRQLHPLQPERIGVSSFGLVQRAEILKWRNFSFYYEQSVQERRIASSGMGAINSETYLSLNGGRDRVAAIEWISENAFPKRLRGELRSAIAEKRRLPGEQA